MSTPSGPYRESLARLTERVVSVHRLELRAEGSRRSWRLAALALATAGAAALVEWALHGDTLARTLFAAAFVVSLAGAGLHALVPWLRAAGLLQGDPVLRVAGRIGRAFPTVRDRLINTLQLGPDRPDAEWVSPELSAEAVRRLTDDLATLDLASAVDRRPASAWRSRAALAAAALAVLTTAFPGPLTGAWVRLAQFTTSFTPPPAYRFEVTPGNAEVVKGGSVDVRVVVRSSDGLVVDRPLAVELSRRLEGQTTVDRTPLRRDPSGAYRLLVSDIRFTTEYAVAIGSVASDTYRLTVLDRPVITSLRLRIDPPAYSGLPRRQQEEFAGDVRALPGSRVSVSGEASKPLQHSRLQLGDSATVPLRTRERSFTGSFLVRADGTYRVLVTDASGLENASPVRYAITLLPDAAPVVRVLEPGRNIDVAGDRPIGLLIEASDDYGLSELRLAYRLSHSKFEPTQETYTYRRLPLPAGDRARVQVIDQWDLSPLHLVPEDVVEYYVEVLDNDDVNGPKSTRSPLYTVRLPSLEEVFTDLDRGQDRALDEMREALEDSKQLRDELQRLSQDLKQNKEADWSKEQLTREMAKRLEEVQRKVDETARQLDELTAQMQEQRVLSAETMEKYLELQSLFQQLDSQALQQALQQMQQSMQNVNRDQLRQALEQAQFSEERFRQGLERTIQLLKRIQVEQKADEVVKRARDLAEQQAAEGRAADSLGRPSEDLARRQEDLAEAQRELEAAARDLEQRMEEFFTEMPAERMAELRRSLEAQQLQELMRAAAAEMRRGELSSARQRQQTAEEALEQFSRQMTSLQQAMLQQQASQTMNALRRARTDLLQISADQEALRNAARSSPANSPRLRENAQGQLRALQDLSNVVSGLSELAQRSFAVTPSMGRTLGEAITSMQNAMRDLEGRNGSMASQDQTAAMGALNRSAQAVQQALQQLMEGSPGSPGGMGLMQQLQMMAGQQQSINLQTQEMGGMEAMRRAAEAARLAREQEAVRKSLEQLDREARASGDGERALGDLRQIAQEMQEVIRQLEQNQASPDLVRRQERILSRLLDASRSMQERDFERRRRATTGRQIVRPGPADLTAPARTRWREELDRALEQGYARDYQELIRRYFEALERERTEVR